MLLAGAAACYAAALLCCAGSRRPLLPARLGLRDSLARYGAGSLANTVLPARLGDGVRVGLFARVVPGGTLKVVGAAAALAFHVETATALAVGVASAVALGLAGRRLPRPRIEDQPPVTRALEREEARKIERHAFGRIDRCLDLVG
jgi:hypothetical protein